MKYLILILVFVSSIYAVSEKLIIDAEKFEASEKKGVSVFTGNVKIQMGKDRLNAQKVKIFFANKKGANSKVPSTYEATEKVSFKIVTLDKKYSGKGDKIIYSPSKQEYTIEGNGFLEEKITNRKMYGDKIYVNQLTGEAKINGSESKPVRIILDIVRGENNKDKK